MESLLYVLDGEAKRTVQSISKTGFYMLLLKTLKRDLGNSNVMSYLKEKVLFELSQLNQQNKPSIRNYQQQPKATAIWLSPMVYYPAIKLIEAVTHLPNYLLNLFHKDFKDIQIDDLLVSLNWLDGKHKEMYNSIASIICFH